MTVSNHSNLLIKIDQGMDRSLVLTWLNSIVDCALKVGLRVRDAICHYLGKNTQTSQKDYWNYLRQKSVTQCAVGMVPVLGYYIGVRMLRTKETAQINAAYAEFETQRCAGNYDNSNIDQLVETLSPEKRAVLWKHSDFAFAMLLNDPSNLQQIPVELLYDPAFMEGLVKVKKLAEYVVYKSKLGLDVDYLANCLRKTGQTDLAEEVLKPSTGKRLRQEHQLAHDDEPVSNTVEVAGQQISPEALLDIEDVQEAHKSEKAKAKALESLGLGNAFAIDIDLEDGLTTRVTDSEELVTVPEEYRNASGGNFYDVDISDGDGI